MAKKNRSGKTHHAPPSSKQSSSTTSPSARQTAAQPIEAPKRRPALLALSLLLLGLWLLLLSALAAWS